MYVVPNAMHATARRLPLREKYCPFPTEEAFGVLFSAML